MPTVRNSRVCPRVSPTFFPRANRRLVSPYVSCAALPTTNSDTLLTTGVLAKSAIRLVMSTLNAGSMTCFRRSANTLVGRSQMRVKTGPTTSVCIDMYCRKYGSLTVPPVGPALRE